METWVGDSLQRLFGISEPTIVTFVIATAQKAKSPDGLFDQLLACDLPDNQDARDFADSLYDKVPRKDKSSSKSKDRKSKDKETVKLLKKNSKFKVCRILLLIPY
jgi:pre-mRNA-splicing factor ATP-dependent RNA helicase DHX16